MQCCTCLFTTAIDVFVPRQTDPCGICKTDLNSATGDSSRVVGAFWLPTLLLHSLNTEITKKKKTKPWSYLHKKCKLAEAANLSRGRGGWLLSKYPKVKFCSSCVDRHLSCALEYHRQTNGDRMTTPFSKSSLKVAATPLKWQFHTVMQWLGMDLVSAEKPCVSYIIEKQLSESKIILQPGLAGHQKGDCLHEVIPVCWCLRRPGQHKAIVLFTEGSCNWHLHEEPI